MEVKPVEKEEKTEDNQEESVTDAWFPIIKGSAGMLRKRKHLQCSHI